MSTKVYYGFRMISKKLPEVLQHLGKAAKEFNALMQEKHDRFVVNTAVNLVDKHQVGISFLAEGETALYPLISAERTLRDRQGDVRKTRLRDSEVDTEVIFKLWHHPKEDTFVGVIYAEDATALHQRLLGMGIARNFAYWNNSDKPENVSVRAWKHRETVWNDCFGERCGPAFRIDVAEVYTSRGPELLSYVPAYETRLNALAEETAFEKYLLQVDGQSASRSVSEAWKKYCEFNRRRRDPASPERALVDGEVARLRETLFLSLTAEVLRKFIPPDRPAPPPPQEVLGV